MNIIALAFDLTAAVEKFVTKAKQLYYAIMLLGYCCPHCQGHLSMIAEGKCRCGDCGMEFDPSEEFQRCSNCGGRIKLRIRRYQCQKCGQDVRSRFLFDGRVFDSQYFKVKMLQSRQRKKGLREKVRQMLAESRSAALPLDALDFNSVPGLLGALNSLTADLEAEYINEVKSEFDLSRYQKHIKAYIGDFPIDLRDIPFLTEDRRWDLIWRFVAVIFLAHTGYIDIWQEENTIMVKKHETDREGCKFSGTYQDTDGFERSVGRIEAG